MSGILSVMLADNASGATAATTWDSASQANETLSNANLTATNSSGQVGGIRSIVPVTTGQKKYWEILIATHGADPAVYPGVANTTKPFDGGLMISGTNSAGYYYDGTSAHFYVNFGGFDGIDSFTSGDRVCFSQDFDAQKIWARVNNGNWNGAVIGSQNPVGAVGGLSTAAISGDLYPAFQCVAGVLTVVTAAFSSAGWLYSAPAGFTQINA